jgi:hypothetical protein
MTFNENHPKNILILTYSVYAHFKTFIKYIALFRPLNRTTKRFDLVEERITAIPATRTYIWW